MSEQDFRSDGVVRRQRMVRQVVARTGITEVMIGELVTRFYDAARRDPGLGPMFARIPDWDGHLAKVKDFWSSVILTSGRYQGQLMRAHLPLRLVGDHYERWLELFESTARAVCPPPAAEHFIAVARRLADNFQTASSAHAQQTSVLR
ncbi:MAG: group III truncated hemoglobin [Alphaproteobacteria bacterium]|nr:group III truncated hemoglobin [Alphaproteobacteria bacterium]